MSRTFIPAAGHDLALPFYDPITKALGIDQARETLIDQADLRAGLRVLDMGCGTGSLILAIARRHPDIRLVGLDPDPRALARCSTKAERTGVRAEFVRGFADATPLAAHSFDRVVTSFMFHHLSATEKRAMLREARRLLKPGGSIHLLDFAHKQGWLAQARLPFFHGDGMRADRDGAIVLLLEEAEFIHAQEVGRRTSFFQTMAYYSASLPPC